MKSRREIVLAILASADGAEMTPVQLQKAAFLIDRNVPHIFGPGERFNFEPYDYGPFDKSVYEETNALHLGGLAQINQAKTGRWKVYSTTQQGKVHGDNVLASLPANAADYIKAVTLWVKSQSFSGLVKSIYAQYPEMKANSVFQG